MATRNRASVKKREREQMKRQRERQKAEKAALKRERRQQRAEQESAPPPLDTPEGLPTAALAVEDAPT